MESSFRLQPRHRFCSWVYWIYWTLLCRGIERLPRLQPSLKIQLVFSSLLYSSLGTKEYNPVTWSHQLIRPVCHSMWVAFKATVCFLIIRVTLCWPLSCIPISRVMTGWVLLISHFWGKIHSLTVVHWE